jgi:hypothetical protein
MDKQTGRDNLLMIGAMHTLSATKEKHEHCGNKQRCQYKGLSYVHSVHIFVT